MATRTSIKILNAALDESPDSPDTIVLRGVVDPSSLANLKVDTYQREILPATSKGKMAKAMAAGARVPDIRLGVRGGNFLERDGAFYLQDDVYIIDGLQRTTSAKMLLEQGRLPRIGAQIEFNTTFAYEKRLFNALNTTNKKLSPNILLRNAAEENPGIEMLKSLCMDSSFALYNRVSWKQLMSRRDAITSVMYLKVAARLHAGFMPGMKDSRHATLANSFERLMAMITRAQTRANVKEFWEVLDSMFDVRNVVYARETPHLKTNFLTVLAGVLADHTDFWNGHKLDITPSLERKIASFKLHDPTVSALCSGVGKSSAHLYNLLVEHINSGKRTKQLRPVKPPVEAPEGLYPDEEGGDMGSAFTNVLATLGTTSQGFEARA